MGADVPRVHPSSRQGEPKLRKTMQVRLSAFFSDSVMR